MSDSAAAAHEPDWPSNYFNYFTEIEEHFQRARGTGLFLLSPLDWALIESWKNAGVPLEAVLAGIDAAFEKWRSRKVRRRQVNSLTYCAQAVAEAAARAPARDAQAASTTSTAPFSEAELRTHLEHCARLIRAASADPAFHSVAAALDSLSQHASEHHAHIEDLERRLTALEDKLVAAATATRTDEDLYGIRDALDRELRPYRSTMTSDQLALLERRYLDAAILEQSKLPRLSLFYLR